MNPLPLEAYAGPQTHGAVQQEPDISLFSPTYTKKHNSAKTRHYEMCLRERVCRSMSCVVIIRHACVCGYAHVSVVFVDL